MCDAQTGDLGKLQVMTVSALFYACVSRGNIGSGANRSQIPLKGNVMKSTVRAIVVASCVISMAVLCCRRGESQQSVSPLTMTKASLPNGTVERLNTHTVKARGGDSGVTFTPSTTGSLNGTLPITDSATDGPQAVALSGTGVSGGLCSRIGQFCAFRRCCPGLICVQYGNIAVDRYCRPETKGTLSENTSRTSSFWDRMNANKLQ